MTNRATFAQTRFLLMMWLDLQPRPHIIGRGATTMDALVRRQWVIPTGRTFRCPNGYEALLYELSEDGFRAAQDGFAAQRWPS